jgi:DNA-binding transcriptional regulator LsrR (DeoR family)
MYAVEFQTRVTNGTIEIPDELKGKLGGLVRVIVLTEDKSAQAGIMEHLGPLERAALLAEQTAAERGAKLLREASLNQDRIAASWAAAMREMGISGEPVGPEKLREMMLADGVNPEDNQFSRGIIEMREE